MTTYSAVDIAKYIVSYCSGKHRPVSNLKLQKMLYYTWIDYYKKTGTALFFNEICAWQLGPVVPDAYYEFCSYAGTPINRTYEVELSSGDTAIINKITDDYIPIPASTLVNRSHRKGGPWDTVYQDGLGNRGIIPFSLIEDMECAVTC